MMKKLFALSAIVMATMLTTQAHAVATALGAGGVITPLNCATLDNNVTIQTSTGVSAGYNCNAAGTSFVAATCHSAGTNRTTTQDCTWTAVTDNNGVVQSYTRNFSACSANPVNGGEQISYTGRIGFRGTSSGGSVSDAELLSANCNDTSILTMVPDSEVP